MKCVEQANLLRYQVDSGMLRATRERQRELRTTCMGFGGEEGKSKNKLKLIMVVVKQLGECNNH